MVNLTDSAPLRKTRSCVVRNRTPDLPVETTRVGVGRFWVIDLECRNQHGEFVGRDTYDCFGYRRPAA